MAVLWQNVKGSSVIYIYFFFIFHVPFSSLGQRTSTLKYVCVHLPCVRYNEELLRLMTTEQNVIFSLLFSAAGCALFSTLLRSVLPFTFNGCHYSKPMKKQACTPSYNLMEQRMIWGINRLLHFNGGQNAPISLWKWF